MVLFLERGECRGEIRGFPGGKLEGDRRGGDKYGRVRLVAGFLETCLFLLEPFDSLAELV